MALRREEPSPGFHRSRDGAHSRITKAGEVEGENKLAEKTHGVFSAATDEMGYGGSDGGPITNRRIRLAPEPSKMSDGGWPKSPKANARKNR